MSARDDFATRDIAYVAVFAGLIVALTLIPAISLGVGPVPITLQTLAVSLAGAILGWRRGALAVLTYIALIAIGLPVAAHYKSGPGVITGPTGGYLIGFVLMAAAIGFLAERILRRPYGAMTVPAMIGACLAGLPLAYAVGVPWLKVSTGMEWATALKAGLAYFLPGDIIKAVLAGVVAAGVARALPDLAGLRRR